MSPFAERNRKIAEAYLAGQSLASIGADHGISMTRAHQIAVANGGRISREERSRRFSAHSARIARDPEVRAKIAAKIKAKWDNGMPGGRRMIFANEPAKREDYLSLRTAYGAATARAMMGISA